MFKLMDKKLLTIIRPNVLFILAYCNVLYPAASASLDQEMIIHLYKFDKREKR